MSVIRKYFVSRHFTILLLFVAVSIGACSDGTRDKPPLVSGTPHTTFPMPPPNGKSVLNMGWQLFDGQRNIVADYKGKVLVLDFYATWCAPCRDSVPHLIDVQHRFGPRGLAVVGLNVGGPDDLDKVSDFAREFRIDYTLATPDSNLVSFLLGEDASIPQTFVFDRSGQMVQRFVGYGPSTGPQLDRVIQTALDSTAD